MTQDNVARQVCAKYANFFEFQLFQAAVDNEQTTWPEIAIKFYLSEYVSALNFRLKELESKIVGAQCQKTQHETFVCTVVTTMKLYSCVYLQITDYTVGQNSQ